MNFYEWLHHWLQRRPAAKAYDADLLKEVWEAGRAADRSANTPG